MKRCLDELHSKYPSLAQDSLENLVLLANGSVNAASQVSFEYCNAQHNKHTVKPAVLYMAHPVFLVF